MSCADCGHEKSEHATGVGIFCKGSEDCMCITPTSPLVPRVARSLDDLQVSQVVATICSDGSAGECLTFHNEHRGPYERFMADGGTVVILSEPVPDHPPPTTPGSVIEGKDSEGIACLMYRLDTESVGNQITASWVDVTGCYWHQSDLTLVRVLFDAGAVREANE